MSKNRHLARAGAVAFVAFCATLLGSGTASAHVTANVYGEQPEQGGYTAVVLRVPNEDDKLATTKLEVAFDEAYQLGSVRTRPIPGWRAEVVTTKLDEPVTNVRGAELTEVVTKVVWTAEKGSEIKPGEYQEMEFSTGPLPDDTDQLVLPATQTYQQGKVVEWHEAPADGADLERPAPVVPLAAPSEGDSGTSVAPTANTAESAADTTARWLGGIGLAVGALGLGVGVGATARTRNRTAR